MKSLILQTLQQELTDLSRTYKKCNFYILISLYCLKNNSRVLENLIKIDKQEGVVTDSGGFLLFLLCHYPELLYSACRERLYSYDTHREVLVLALPLPSEKAHQLKVSLSEVYVDLEVTVEGDLLEIKRPLLDKLAHLKVAPTFLEKV